MSCIQSLPLVLKCRCGQQLFEGMVTICHEGLISSYDLIVSQVAMTCSSCRKHLAQAEDDFVRAVEALQHHL